MSNGILVVNKPPDISSYGVVDLIKKWSGITKVGHGGTLDPFAEGVLVVLVGKATKIADQFLSGEKAYRFILRLDAETDTLDKTGTIVKTYDGPPVDKSNFEEVLEAFRGEVEHRTPAYAAAKVKGKRLYKLARKGIDVERPVKRVTIYELILEDFEWPRARIFMRCSKGTYVRQIGADIARKAGCCGYIEHLVRIQSGTFTLDDAWSLEEIKDAIRDGHLERVLIPLADAVEHLPAVVMDNPILIRRLKNGNLDPLWADEQRRNLRDINGPVRIITEDDERLLALWWPFKKEQQKRTLRVLF